MKRARLVIEVEYAVGQDDPRHTLEAAANYLASEGLLTGYTDLEVETWLATVTVAG